MKYEITREFIGGTLKGLTITQTMNSDCGYRIGQVVKNPYGNTSPYKILEIRKYSPVVGE